MRFRVIAPLAGLLVLVGCSVPSPSVAVRVGDQVITMRAVDAAVGGCEELLGGQNAGNVRSDVISTLVVGSAVEVFAREAGIEISQSAVDQAVAQTPLADLVSNPECKKVVDASGRFRVAASQLGDQRVIYEVSRVRVELNPLLGQWDTSTLQLIPGSGSISEPASPEGVR